MPDYQSVFDGKQIDDGIGKIINGGIDKAVLDAQAAATSAQTDAVKTAADRLVVEGAANAERGRAAEETKRVTAEKARASGEASRSEGEKARKIAEDGRIARDAAERLCEPYDPMRDYVTGNKAVQSGSTYRCTAPCRGIAPPDRTKWLLVAAKGADGMGAGDMTANVYDPNGRRQDIFAFAEAKMKEAESASRPKAWVPTAADIGAAAPSVAVSAVLTAAGWVGAVAPYTQSIAVSGVTAANNLSVGLAAAATEAQERDAAGCRVKAAAQTAGSLGFTAQDKPTLDLPVTVLIFG